MNNEIVKEKKEFEEAEVNVYGWSDICGTIKVHCMYDCWGDTAWLSTDN